MSWRDGLAPVRMQRIALVAPVTELPAMLERVGDAAVVELEPPEVEPDRAAELQRRVTQATTRGPVGAVAGWVPAPALPELTDRLARLGAAAVPLAPPRGTQPPTLLERQ